MSNMSISVGEDTWLRYSDQMQLSSAFRKIAAKDLAEQQAVLVLQLSLLLLAGAKKAE